MSSDRPHVIYIMSDEHRGQAMSHAGDPNVRTPTMDRLATEGVSFSRAYSNCPICTPSRGTMFSGRHAHAGPVSGFFDVYKATAPSTATLLRDEGYHTAYFGKWHCGIVHDQVPPEARENPDDYKGSANRTPEYHRAGFQDWHAFENLNQHFASYFYKGDDVNPTKVEGYEPDGLTDVMMEYLEGYDRDEPLFAVLSVTPPHFPMIVPEKWRRFDPDGIEVRPNFAKQNDFYPYESEVPEGELREMLASYYAMIENLDWNMGRLVDKIQSLPGFENTIIVYFSDHGDYVGSHGLITTKIQHHEESVSIPAIFHWPGGIPACEVQQDGLFSLVDLMATTLGLLGVDVPPHNQGCDFSPQLRGDAFAGPDAILLEMVNNPRWNLRFLDWRGVVTERWKYAFCETGREQLFDLDADPFEMNDLSVSNPDQLEVMKQRLLTLLDESREPYFDVLINHGVAPEGPVLDVSGRT